MFQKVQEQLQWRADLLLSGRFEDPSREYLLPLALYLEDHLVVLSSPAQVIALAADLHEVLRARSVHRCEISVTAIELPRDGRFRVWGVWHEMSREPEQSRRSDVIHYMRQTEHGIRSEMVHFTRLGSTELRDYAPRDRLFA